MKFVKENLTLVIVAAVILLAIVSIFYPTGSLKGKLRTTMQERMSSEASIRNLQNQEIKIPGVEAVYKGIPSEKMVQAKEHALNYMKEQSAKVVEVGAAQNKLGRVTKEGVPMFMGQPQPGFLPKINGAAPMAFKDTYGAVFPFWNQQLTGVEGGPTMPPNETELRTIYEEQKRIREANRPATAQPIADDTRMRTEFDRREVMNRASKLQMYVDNTSFQQRAWLHADAAPNEQNIFEALVDSWLQSDVVRAIEQTNKEAFAKNGGDKNVTTAAIKRLMRVTVGNEAQATRLGTFDNATNTSQPNVVAAPPPTQPGTPGTTNLFFMPQVVTGGEAGAVALNPAAQPNTIEFSRTMTGRASGTEYDVVLMQINVDIDPSWLNRFIDQLYRQNMGYTVLNVRMRTVDPLSRASMGFVYGEQQVIEAEIVVEALLFRDWTRPMMPERIRTALGLPPEEAPAEAPAAASAQ